MRAVVLVIAASAGCLPAAPSKQPPGKPEAPTLDVPEAWVDPTTARRRPLPSAHRR